MFGFIGGCGICDRRMAVLHTTRLVYNFGGISKQKGAGEGGDEVLFVFCLLWGNCWIADYFPLQLVGPHPFDSVFDDDLVYSSLRRQWWWWLW